MHNIEHFCFAVGQNNVSISVINFCNFSWALQFRSQLWIFAQKSKIFVPHNVIYRIGVWKCIFVESIFYRLLIGCGNAFC